MQYEPRQLRLQGLQHLIGLYLHFDKKVDSNLTWRWPAGHVAEDAVIEEDALLSIDINVECWYARGIVVDYHDARAVETLGLVNEQVTALVVHIVGNDKALWAVEKWREEKIRK